MIFIILLLFSSYIDKDPITSEMYNSNISMYTISGRVIWEHDDTTGIPGVVVTLSGSDFQVTTTDSNGNYSFTVPTTGTYTITPLKNTSLTNGLSGDDATLIQQHLTGTSYIVDFYKLVAADCNASLTISSVDAALIRQAIIGNPSALNILNATKSWKFIPTSYTYPIPFGPYSLPNFPKIITLTINSDSFGNNFYGIKTGDLNGTANPAL